MLTLVIGGRAQGKTEYLQEQFGLNASEIAPAAAFAGEGSRSAVGAEEKASPRALVHLEELVRLRGAKEKREFRDEVGRALCALAKRAERVFRVIAGIGQRIK